MTDTYQEVPIANPPYRPNELFVSCEDLRSPRFRTLLRRHGLKDVIAGEGDEFRRLLLLRDWVHCRMPVCAPGAKAAGGGRDALGILEEAETGGSFLCGQFTTVYNAVLNALGYPARFIHSGTGSERKDRCTVHAVTEVWCNSLGKWLLLDAKHNIHFEREGVPLSALEIRDDVLRNGGSDLTRVRGLERRPYQPPVDADWFIEYQPGIYTWLSWELQGNLHSAWPSTRSSVLVVYEDDYFRNHTWYRIRGGEVAEHWAYGADCFLRVRHRDWLEWTPNVLDVKARIKGRTARVVLASSTPNFKEYQMAEQPGGSWRRMRPQRRLRLVRDRHEWLFRAVNLAGVGGPPYRLVVASRAPV